MMRKILAEREQVVQHDPDLLITGRIDQSTIFYLLRVRILKAGIKLALRKTITEYIADVYEEMGYKRHELGIIAAERAQLSFRGQTIGVGFDEIDRLAKIGTDMVIIEKEGIVKALEPFGEQYGISLVFTRGFATEYALELAKRTKANIAILTDFNASGLLIVTKIHQMA